VLALIFLIAFPFALWNAWRNIQRGKASLNWPTATATITAAKRVKRMFRAQPRLAYTYAVGDKSYTSQRLSFAGGVLPRETDAVLARYPVGASAPIRYSPAQPAEAVLEPGDSPLLHSQFKSLIVMFVIIVATNVAMFYLKRLSPENAQPTRRVYQADAATLAAADNDVIRANAEKGSATDQYYLGMNYLTGHGVTKDLPQAAVWLEKAANQNQPDAQAFLGEMYASGNGTTKNVERAVELFRKAVAGGSERGFLDLGYAYEKGIGVPQDAKQAVELYRKAKPNPRAQEGLARLGAPPNQ
jgi:hypothetical protein